MPEQRDTDARGHFEALPTPNLFHSKDETRKLSKPHELCNSHEAAVQFEQIERTDKSGGPRAIQQVSSYNYYKHMYATEQASREKIKLSTPVESADSDIKVIVTNIQSDSTSFSKSCPFSLVLQTSRASISETSRRTDANLNRSTSNQNISQHSTPQSARQQQSPQKLTSPQYAPKQHRSQQQTHLQPTLRPQTSQQQTSQQQTSQQQTPQQQLPQQRISQQLTSQQQTPQQQRTSTQQMPQQNSRRQQKTRKRKRKPLVVRRSEDIDNYVGNKPIHELLQFIESR